MKRQVVVALAAVFTLLTASTSLAQIARRSPGTDAGPAPANNGTPRDPRFPYAGVWRGTRIMPIGSDQIGFRFTVADDKYTGVTLHPNGGTAPQNALTATAAGLSWEQPNSGGGTWVFRVRLAGPDSMVGTLVLRDPPPNLTPAPTGTMVLLRQAAPAASPRPTGNPR